MPPLILSLLPGLIKQLFDRFIPDKNANQQAKDDIDRYVAAGDYRFMDGMSGVMQTTAEIAKIEAQSSDKYTSRARPTFLYVMYFLFCFIPFFCGLLGIIFNLDIARNFISLFKEGISSLPDYLWYSFSACFIGYTVGRSGEKITAIKSNVSKLSSIISSIIK